MVNEVM